MLGYLAANVKDQQPLEKLERKALMLTLFGVEPLQLKECLLLPF
jgi:hypothetical protein